MEMNLLYAVSGLIVLILIVILILYSRLNGLSMRYREFMAGGNGVSLEGTLTTLQAELQKARDELAENRQQLLLVKSMMSRTFQAVGVVRFNAFQDTGSDLSFAVALLDGKGSGVLISSIYGREESRTYAKPVKEGVSTYPLSGEEQEAIKKALVILHGPAVTTGKKQ